MNTAEKKYVYRLPPCPDYDPEAMESWLTDLAREGLLLEPEKPFCGFFTFRIGAPQILRYRLEPVGKTQSFWDGDPGMPKEAFLSLAEEMGWEYVSRYGDFWIYRCEDPQAPEMHTDPQLQSAALELLRKRQRNDFQSILILLSVHLLWGVMGYPVGLCIVLGTPVAAALGLLVLGWVIRPLISIFYLRKLRAKLTGGSIDHRKDWRRGLRPYRIRKLLALLLQVIAVCGLLSTWIRDTDMAMPIAEYPSDPPFVTIADLNPEGMYEEKGLGYGNTVKQWSDYLSPVNLEWDELAQVTLEDGTKLCGSLDVSWHETAAPFLAKQLAREFIHQSREKPLSALPEISREEKDGITIFRYIGKYHYRTVILIKENIVVKASFLVDSSETNQIEILWTQKMLQNLRSI